VTTADNVLWYLGARPDTVYTRREATTGLFAPFVKFTEPITQLCGNLLVLTQSGKIYTTFPAYASAMGHVIKPGQTMPLLMQVTARMPKHIVRLEVDGVVIIARNASGRLWYTDIGEKAFRSIVLPPDVGKVPVVCVKIIENGAAFLVLLADGRLYEADIDVVKRATRPGTAINDALVWRQIAIPDAHILDIIGDKARVLIVTDQGLWQLGTIYYSAEHSKRMRTTPTLLKDAPMGYEEALAMTQSHKQAEQDEMPCVQCGTGTESPLLCRPLDFAFCSDVCYERYRL
jgi:hypothetical protein